MLIRGEVQGVGFREFTRRESERLGLNGWVRNLRDGGVEAYAEGEESQLETWLGRLRQGPPSAHVKEVAPVWEEAREVQGFTINPTAPTPEPFSNL